MINLKFTFDQYFGFDYNNPIEDKQTILKQQGFIYSRFNQYTKIFPNYNLIIIL